MPSDKTVSIPLDLATEILDYLARAFWYHDRDQYFNDIERCCKSLSKCIDVAKDKQETK